MPVCQRHRLIETHSDALHVESKHETHLSHGIMRAKILQRSIFGPGSLFPCVALSRLFSKEIHMHTSAGLYGVHKSTYKQFAISFILSFVLVSVWNIHIFYRLALPPHGPLSFRHQKLQTEQKNISLAMYRTVASLCSL